MCKVATFLATTSLLLVVSIISNAGSVVGGVAENNNSRVLESKKKRAKQTKRIKSSKVSKTKSEKKKNKKAKGTNIQSNSPFSPFDPVCATIAVPAGTGAPAVQEAAEAVAIGIISPRVGVGELKVTTILDNCDCILVSSIFPTPDACECYETTIFGTATDPHRATGRLFTSLRTSEFGRRMNQIIPNSTANNDQVPPFSTCYIDHEN